MTVKKYVPHFANIRTDRTVGATLEWEHESQVGIRQSNKIIPDVMEFPGQRAYFNFEVNTLQLIQFTQRVCMCVSVCGCMCTLMHLLTVR